MSSPRIRVLPSEAAREGLTPATEEMQPRRPWWRIALPVARDAAWITGALLAAGAVYLARHDRTTVMWDVTAETFTDTPQTTGQIVDGTVSQTRPGSIILLHPWNGRTHTQEAIGPIVRQLRADGYTFVSVSELLAMRDVG